MRRGRQKKEVHGNGRSRREAAVLLQRRTEVFKRWSDGETQTAIARSLKVSKATISLDIAAGWRDWREANRGSVSEHVEAEIRLLNRCQLEAESEWENTRDGRFLELILSCSDRRRKLLGLDAPARAEIKTDATVVNRFLSKEEMRQQVVDGLRRLREERAHEQK